MRGRVVFTDIYSLCVCMISFIKSDIYVSKMWEIKERRKSMFSV